MSDLEATTGLSSGAGENNLLLGGGGDETDDGRLLSDSHVEPESETSGPSSDEAGDEDNVCDAAKSNKR